MTKGLSEVRASLPVGRIGGFGSEVAGEGDQVFWDPKLVDPLPFPCTFRP